MSFDQNQEVHDKNPQNLGITILHFYVNAPEFKSSLWNTTQLVELHFPGNKVLPMAAQRFPCSSHSGWQFFMSGAVQVLLFCSCLLITSQHCEWGQSPLVPNSVSARVWQPPQLIKLFAKLIADLCCMRLMMLMMLVTIAQSTAFSLQQVSQDNAKFLQAQAINHSPH